MEGLQALDFGKEPTGEGGDTYRKAAKKIQANFDAISAEMDRKANANDSGAAVAQEKADRVQGDANTLISAKGYTDQVSDAKLTTAKAYADTVGSTTLTGAKSYADGVGAARLNDAKAYSDTQDAKVTSAANARMDSGDASTLTSAKSYTDGKITALIGGAPETLNTLKELADALGDDKDYAAHVTAELGLKAYTTEVDKKDASILAQAKAYTDSSPAGSASKPYVDSQDAATLASSKAYTDSLAKGEIKPSGVSSSGRVIGTGDVSAIVATNGQGSGQTSIMMKREGGPTDQKQWEAMHDGGGAYVIRAVNDNYTNAQAALQITRGTGVTVATMLLMPAQGNVVAGPIADDGQARLQVGGKVGLRTDYAEIRMRAASGANLNGWRIISNINGAQDGSLVFQHSTDNYGTNFTDALTMGAGGNVFIATTAPPAGPSALNIGNAMLLYSPQYDNIGMFSTSSYSGGLAIEAASGDNKTKKNIALAPWGGRVLVGSGVGDDGASALRVQGQAAINGNAIVGGNLTAGANIVGTTQYRQGLEGDGTAVALYNDPGKRNFVVRSGPSTAYKFTQITEAGDLLSPGGGYFSTKVQVPQLVAEGPFDLANASLFLNNTGTNGRKYSVASRGTTDFAISDETAGATRLTIKADGTVVAKGNVQVDGSHNVSGATNANQINATGLKINSGNQYSSVVIAAGAYTPRIQVNSGDSSIGFVNGANTAYNMQVFDSGSVLVNRGGLTVNGSMVVNNGATFTDRIYLNRSGWQADLAMHNNRSGQDVWVHLRARDGGGLEVINSAYNGVPWQVDNAGNVWQGGGLSINGGLSLTTAITIGDGRMYNDGNVFYAPRGHTSDLWARTDDLYNNLGGKANAGAQCQISAYEETGPHSIVGGTQTWFRRDNPWVINGLAFSGGTNMWIRWAWLRNQ
ncbi:hypothetical protein ACV22Y_19815 [Burkholderia sp. AW50-3]